MERVSLARRAARLATGAGDGHGAGSIGFDSGHAYPGILPDLRAAAERALGEYRAETLQYAARPGLPDMRAWIGDYMRRDGAQIGDDGILVVNGAKHGIELICRLLLDEGDSIVVTAPTYYTSIPIFRSFGAGFIEVGQDEEGMDVAAIADRLERLRREGAKPPKFIYNVPEYHNPTGVTMSTARRRALVELARTHGLYVVEDSPYREVRFDGDRLPTLQALDQTGTVITVGTFAKLMAPGLRIGWIAADPDLVGRIIQLKSDGGSSPLVQRIIVEFMRAGGFDPHIDLVRRTYRSHRDHMVAAVRRELPDATVRVPDGGYYLWLAFPEGIDGSRLAALAEEEGVTVIPGRKFFADDRAFPQNSAAPTNHVRLAFSHAAPEEIDEGVRRLATAYGRLRATPRTS